MKSFKTSLIFSLLCLVSLDVFADCSSTACLDVQVENLYIRANGNILVMTSGSESELSCTESGAYLTLRTSDENSDKVYAALLAAKTANKALQISIIKDSIGCVIQRVEYGKFF